MRFVIFLALMMVGLPFVLPAPAADEKNKEDAPAIPTKEKKGDDPKAADDKKADDKKIDDKKVDDKAADDKKASDKKADDKTPDDKKADDKKADDKKADAKKDDDKKTTDSTEKPKDKADKKPDLPKDKLKYTGTITAKVLDVQSSQKLISVEVTHKLVIPTANTGAISAMQDLQRQMGDAARIANPRDRYNKLIDLQRQIAKQQANLVTYTTQNETQKLDFTAADDVKIRVGQPPVVVDEKGFPKKYKPKDLKELKGPEGYPGYPGDFDSLRTGQIVMLYYSQKNAPARPKGKEKDKDLDKDLLADTSKPTAVMVVVLQEPPEPK